MLWQSRSSYPLRCWYPLWKCQFKSLLLRFQTSSLPMGLGKQRKMTQYLGLYQLTVDLDGVHGFWLWPSPVPAVVAIWGKNQRMKIDLSVSFSLCHSAFQIN